MELIRIIHPRFWYKEDGRFNSGAFSKSGSNSGVSVLSRVCVDQHEHGLGICGHVYHYYRRISSIPAIFLEFKSENLPSQHKLKNTPSDTGDDCHFDILGMTTGKCRRFIIEIPLTDFDFCYSAQGHRRLTEGDIAMLDDMKQQIDEELIRKRESQE